MKSVAFKVSFLASFVCLAGLLAGLTYIMNINSVDVASHATNETTATRLGPTKTFYGYYGDLDENGTTNVSKEKLVLNFSTKTSVVEGVSSGEATYENKSVQRKWKVQGFFRDPQVVLGIVTIASPQDPKPPTGIGSMYLAKAGENSFTGTTVYLDCVFKVVQCPYALSLDDISSGEAKVRWSELFRKPCDKLELNPGLQKAELPPCA